MRYIVVDGYNVIRADPRLQAIEDRSLEQAREVLVQTLSSSPRLSGDQVLVVFDGTRGTRSHVHMHRRGRVGTLYSARGQTADDVIVAQVEQLSSQGRVVVVSNDNAVRESCRAAGAEVSGSENFLSQMPGRRRPDRVSGREDDEPASQGLSTRKKGNPRRAPRRAGKRDFRF